jgi:hypothetical protein
MSNAPLSYNPYLPPDEVLAEPAHRGRPGMLTTLCVLAIVLGALGLLTGFAGVGSLVFGKQIQTSFQPQKQPGISEEMVQIQKDYQAELMGIQDQYIV